MTDKSLASNTVRIKELKCMNLHFVATKSCPHCESILRTSEAINAKKPHFGRKNENAGDLGHGLPSFWCFLPILIRAGPQQ